MLSSLSILLLLLLVGCTRERAYIVRPSIEVQLAEQLEDVDVWVFEDQGDGKPPVRVKAKATLWEGLWIVFDDTEWTDNRMVDEMGLRKADEE